MATKKEIAELFRVDENGKVNTQKNGNASMSDFELILKEMATLTGDATFTACGDFIRNIDKDFVLGSVARPLVVSSVARQIMRGKVTDTTTDPVTADGFAELDIIEMIPADLAGIMTMTDLKLALVRFGTDFPTPYFS